MDKQQLLAEKIEEARLEMFRLSKKYPLVSVEVLNASRKLDKLLNQHARLKVG